MWGDVTGQEQAVGTLRAAVDRPSHAYLLVGSRGSGVVEASRAFAASLIGAADERSQSLVARGAHPDVVEFEPTTATYTLPNEIRSPRAGETARRDASLPRVIPEIHKAPIEGDRKVVILRDAERLDPTAGNTLLKSIEEPPPRTVVLLLTDRPDALLPTIRSRCSRVDFAYAPPVRSDAIAETRQVFSAAAGAVTGRTADVVEIVERLEAALAAAGEAFDAAAKTEAADLDEDIERRGYPPRTASALRRRLADRHQQEQRRARVDALREGLAALEAVYFDALRETPGALAVAPHRASEAIDSCRTARKAEEFNPNVGALLLALVARLPVPGAAR